jgi:formylglycine-generating enzyme required for sulfatase activity/sugar lactone lactonase YvrE
MKYLLPALALLSTACVAFAADTPVTGERWENSLGMKFTTIPGTDVRFSIWETRVRDFAAFTDATGHVSTGDVYSLDPVDHQWKVHPKNTWRSPGFEQTPDFPIVNVSWNDANAFCQWLTNHDRAAGRIDLRQLYRLPSDAEWSAAAGPSMYPWGDQYPPPPRAGHYFGTEQENPKRPIIDGYNDGARFTTEVGRYLPNVYGLYDMAGNVWEWCSDFYRKALNTEELRRELPFLNMDEGGAKLRVLRGGGWVEALPNRLATSFRSFGQPTNRYCVGFRVVLARVAEPVSTTSLLPPSIELIPRSSVAWTIDDPGFLPEGIAYDLTSSSFYVSSRLRRKIVRIDSAGRVSELISSGQNGIWIVLGIAVDAPRQQLWAVSSSFRGAPGIPASEENRAGVFCFALPSGELIHKFLQETPGDRYLDDVAVAPDGRVFVSDPGHGEVLVIDTDRRAMETFIAQGKIRAPQGLALTPDGSRLFISDYAGALWGADTRTGSMEELAASDGVELGGIDGFAFHKGHLIGVFNERAPHQVVRFQLDSTQSRVERREVLESNHPQFDEPTLGVVVGEQFYYVANGQGTKAQDRSRAFDDTAFSPPVILKLKLQ